MYCWPGLTSELPVIHPEFEFLRRLSVTFNRLQVLARLAGNGDDADVVFLAKVLRRGGQICSSHL